MKSLLKSIFIKNWPRKCLSIFLAIIVWYLINQSLTTTINIHKVPIRVVNIPPGKTVERILPDGRLSKRVSLTLSGRKNVLEALNSNNIEILVDASNKKHRWIEKISKSNIHTTGTTTNLLPHISHIAHKSVNIELTNLVTEKIPITITQPIGEAPKGYHFLDVWPYQLFITISGPETSIKKLKSRGIKLTFNLNDIPKSALDDLQASGTKAKDVVSFYVPNQWKQLELPYPHEESIEINDPNAEHLRIDFVRNKLIAIPNFIPVSLFFPPSIASDIQPAKMSISNAGNLINTKHGLKVIGKPLFAKGVSELFVELMSDMMEIVCTIAPNREGLGMGWSLQFVNHRALEDKYISMLTADASEKDLHAMRPQIREEYLRNRFRNFMHKLQLYINEHVPLKLDVIKQGNSIIVNEQKNHDS